MICWSDLDPRALADDLSDRIATLRERLARIEPAAGLDLHGERLAGIHRATIRELERARILALADADRLGWSSDRIAETWRIETGEILRALWERGA